MGVTVHRLAVAAWPGLGEPAAGPAPAAGWQQVDLTANGVEELVAELAAVLDAGGQAAWVLYSLGPHATVLPVLHRLVNQRSDAVAAASAAAAERLAGLLEAGRDLAQLVYPPVLGEGAPAGPPAPPELPRVEVTDRPVPPGAPWLRLTPTGVQVAGAAVNPLQARALRARVGPTPAGDGHRLLVAPANWAGQGRAWAQAVQDHVPGWEAKNLQLRLSTGAGLVFEADMTVEGEQWVSPVTRADLALQAVWPATHLLWEDLMDFAGWDWLGEPVVSPAGARRAIGHLKETGRQVAVLVHGSAGRTPATHAAWYPWSPFRFGRDSFQTAMINRAVAVHQALEGLDVPLFTATLDMLDFLPQATWVPIVIGRQDFAPAPAWRPRGRLKVAHIPSSGLLKGSAEVDAALDGLDRAGVIEYVRLQGVSPLVMPLVVRQMDVVVDQIVLGNPATLMNQTLAAGRLAVAYIAPHVRRRYPEPAPVVQADPSTIADVIEDIARDPAAYQAVAAAGPAFARAWHDGRAAAEALRQGFLEAGLAGGEAHG
ncbi:MAG: hypothetical protein LBR19_03500 [Bifidobacteriaceae bacterium]|jgi:hypothetical protein|nr:hypothetical protein [Bifidobacteriaceae bacterium]